MIKQEQFGAISPAFKTCTSNRYSDKGVSLEGTCFIKMWDAQSKKSIIEWEKKNVITLDASILMARLFKNHKESNNCVNMLAVGTGARGHLLHPEAPTNEQRKLNDEIERKGFSHTTFRDRDGNAVSYPTNVVDFTTVFGESEAVGHLNEMGLVSTYDGSSKNLVPDAVPRDTTVDLTRYDTLVNYLTFAVISKPSTAILSITWRLTF